MKKWNLIIDVAECENCNNCVLAAKDELVGNDFPGYSAPHAPQGTGVIRIDRTTRGVAPIVDAAYLPRMCNHCDDAPCMKADASYGGQAITKRKDGIVIIDPVKAKGRRDLVDACPYGSIVWHEELQLPQSWFFDAHLLDSGWREPRCVTVCPTQAIEALQVTDQDMREKSKALGLRTLKPELKTKARVYYRNLNRIDKCFVGGSVTVLLNELCECVADCDVELSQKGQVIANAVTDSFGDFRIDNLSPHSGAFEVSIKHKTWGAAHRSLSLGETSVVLGDIALEV